LPAEALAQAGSPLSAPQPHALIPLLPALGVRFCPVLSGFVQFFLAIMSILLPKFIVRSCPVCLTSESQKQMSRTDNNNLFREKIENRF
jgi:hypothetical protein